jgi:lambda family phage tail tape measure protein
VADFQLKVTAETQRAEKDLQRLESVANTATKERKLNINIAELNKSFRDVEKNVKEASNTIQTFYRVSKNIPGVGERVREFEALAKNTAELARNAPASAAALRENTKAGSVLSNTFEAASAGAGRLINTLAKTGFAIFAVKEAVGVLQGAFSGFFNETIGREVKLRETILKTQTTLASTNKVFRNGAEITDPYEKIVALTGEVAKRIDSIRERSIALAGVTSNEVIEVFGIVASQIGQIGGGLKDAEDLAINFSAALGTFGIPLFQARQEIGSILRGDITMDSYLAKSLGITNDEIARAKTQAGGVIKFLEERLAASVAGQRIAAQGFAGVVSNIRDLAELVSQRFGAGLLDPLLGGLTKVFDFLFAIREEVFAVSEGLGRGLGSLLSTNLTIIGGGSALFEQIGAGAEGFATQLAESIKRAFASLQADANQVIAPIRNLLEELTKTLGVLTQGLAKLAEGFISIQIENFKALVQIFSNLSEVVTIFASGLSQVLKVYGQLLQVPFVQYLSQISAQFQLLERLGVMSAVKLGFAAVGLIAAWKPIVTFFQSLATKIAALIGGMVTAVGLAVTRMGTIVAAFAATLAATNPAVAALQQQLIGLSASLTAAGGSAEKAGASIARFGGATASAAKGVAATIFGFVKFNLALLAVQVAITALIDLFGRWQKAQDKAVSDRRAEAALVELRTVYKDVGESADEATRRVRDFKAALVDAKYNEAIQNLEEVRKKIEEIKDLTSDNDQDLGGYARRLAQLFNPANFDAITQQQRGELFSDTVLRLRKQQEKEAAAEVSRWAQEVNKKAAAENIRLEAQNRVNLEKEIGEIKRQQESQLFQLRQQQAQKEVDIFRLAGELRIFQMEEANKKLIEGEQGASAAALAALNNYLSTRERGELEIESAKKQLVIEVANLERQISDYRLDNEKKIAEIRKRAGDYEQKVADYRRQLAGTTPTGGAPLRGGGVVTQRNDPDGQQTGSDISLAGGRGAAIQNPFANLKITGRGTQGRGSGPTGRGFGNYVTGEVVINGKTYEVLLGHLDSIAVNVGDVLSAGAVIGKQGITGRATGPHVTTHVNAKNDGNPGAVLSAIETAWTRGTSIPSAGMTPSAPPTAPSFADIGAPAVAKYADAVRGLASAMERLRALQAALTNARTKAAFEEIAKAAFPRENVEQYQDALLEARLSLEALANTEGVFSPEKAAIEVRYQQELLVMQRERAQILERAAKAEGVTKAELDRLEKSINDRIAQRKRDLAEIRAVQQQTLLITQAQQAAESAREALRNQRTDLSNQTNDLRTRAYMIREGFKPEDIDLQLRMVEAARQYQERIRPIVTLIDELKAKQASKQGLDAAEIATLTKQSSVLEQLTKDYNALITAIRGYAAAQQEAQAAAKWQEAWGTNDDIFGGMRDGMEQFAASLGTLKENMADFTNNSMRGLSNAFVELFTTGTTNFRQLAANIITDMTRIIFTQMVLKNILGGLFGGSSFKPIGGSLFGFAEGGVFGFASGGIVDRPTLFRFANGGAMNTGVMGEAGPEAIMPLRRLPNGRLGIEAVGKSRGDAEMVNNITVNVDASGSKVQGDSGRGNQLARAVSEAVQAELLKQKRPGGVLYSGA